MASIWKKYSEYLNDTNPRIKFEMEDGKTFEAELFSEVAPITVENFLKLVDEKFYDGLIFHRVIEGFVIQGGDPEGTGMGGSKDLIKGEFLSNGVKNYLYHDRGVLSMARTMAPNSASSQFFICHDEAPHLNGNYAGFGVLVDGFDTLDFIATQETDFSDKPIHEQKIKKCWRVR
jgi:peptidyl-prolyl cis-trans isomerase B (cyclophilin B)